MYASFFRYSVPFTSNPLIILKQIFYSTILKKQVMADFKRRTLLLSSGKQIKLFGSSIAIGKSLEIGEGYAPNIFSCTSEPIAVKSTASVNNPHDLSSEEIMEMADYNIQLWMDLKANIRKHGLQSAKIFNQDALR
jgi:hypothetical protein